MSKLVVSAGHGGSDPGAVYGNRKEAVIARQIVAEILKQAKARGVSVIDVTANDGSLSGDIARANKSGADLALRIELNSAAGNHGKKIGIETWYADNTVKENIARASLLSRALATHYNLPDRGAKNDKTSRYGRLGWVRDTKMQALIIEWGFIDSDPDMAAILTDIPGGVRVLLDVVAGAAAPVPEPVKPHVTPPTIKKGSKGEATGNWQNRLVELGYALPKYGVDKDFGSETDAATRKLQKDKKIAVDGVVGPKTYGAAGM